MRWRGTIVLAVLVIAAGTYLWLAEAPVGTLDRPGGMLPQVPHEQTTPSRPLVTFEPASVTAVELERGGKRHVLRYSDNSWLGVDDPSLVTEFLQTLVTLGALADIPVLPADLPEFGLDPPLGIVTLHLAGEAEPVVMQIGERNPATTGVYVRVDGSVVLAGALVEWEFDKLFRRAVEFHTSPVSVHDRTPN